MFQKSRTLQIDRVRVLLKLSVGDFEMETP